MKKSDIIKILDRFDDDSEITFRHIETISDDELKEMSYPYPFCDIDYSIEYGDQSYSEKHGYIELSKVN